MAVSSAAPSRRCGFDGRPHPLGPVLATAFRRIAWALVLVLTPLWVACRKEPGPAADLTPANAVASMAGKAITRDEVQRRLNALDPASQRRFSTPEERRKFLDNMVRMELLANAAREAGYDKDPDVLRIVQNQMIEVYLRKEVDRKLAAEAISDAEIETYHRSHPETFGRPEQVRIAHILVKDKGKAEKVYGEARVVGRTDKGFRDLVTKHSEDMVSKAAAGDLRFIDRSTTTVPKKLVEAAFALKEVGDIGGLVATEQGFHVVRLLERRPGNIKPIAEAAPEIRRAIQRERRTRKVDELVADLMKKGQVRIHEEELAKLQTGAAAARAP